MGARNEPTGPGEPLAHGGPAWGGLPVALWPIMERGEMAHHYRATPVILVARSGVGRRWYESGTVRRELQTAPRMIELYAAGFTLDHGRWEGTPGECIGVEFPVPALARLLRDGAHRFAPATCHELFDDQLAGLVFGIWEEATNGSPNGQLFADGLSLALLGLISARHAAPASRRQRFSCEDRRRIQEFIDAALAEDLTLDRLAAEVDLSAFHFARIFKATFECTPHRFVLARFYFLYPELPTIAGVAALRPVMQAACAASEVPCHFLDLQPLWEGNPQFTGGDQIHPSQAGANAIAEAIWDILQENCIAQ